MSGVRGVLSGMAMRLFHLLFARPILKWLVGVRYRRKGLVPEGPCLVVANHNSHLDAAVLLSLFPLRRIVNVHPVAAADYFGENWLRRTMALLFMNAITIRRTRVAGQDPLIPVVQALQAGKSLIFFPEGSRGEAGVVAPFRSGVGRIVLAVPGLQVVPVFLRGPERIWPRGQFVPVPLSIDVSVGKPRSYDGIEDPRQIADEIRHDVLALAPPAAPVPGERSAAPVVVGVCGGDARAREAVARAALERLGGLGKAIGLLDTVVESGPGGLRPVDGPRAGPRRLAWHAAAARLLGTREPYRGSAFAELIRRARLERAIHSSVGVRFGIVEGSPLLDLLARTGLATTLDDRGLYGLALYAEGQRRIPLRSWWKLLRQAPEIWLLNALSLARLRPPRLLILLPGPEPWGEAYARVADLLRRRHRVELLDVGEAAPAAIAERIERRCRELVEVRPDTPAAS